MTKQSIWQPTLLFIFYSLLCVFMTQGKPKITLPEPIICTEHHIDTDAIYQLIPESALLLDATISTDIFFEKTEFDYLTDLTPGQLINPELIIKGLECLFKKNKFSTIKIYVKRTADNAVHLHYVISSVWTLKKIKMHGLFQSKLFTAEHYLMSKGDQFNVAKHKYSLIKIKNALYNSGYCAHTITNSFQLDHVHKEVAIHIQIKRGKRYKITQNTIIINNLTKETLPHAYDESLTKIINKSLHKSYYKKELINAQAQRIKEYFQKKGFLHTALSLQQKLHHNTCTIELEWKVSLYKKKQFIFSGNRHFSEQELLDSIIHDNSSSYLIPLSLFVQEISSLYKKQGFLDPHITYTQANEQSCITIHEGARAKLKKVIIQTTPSGNNKKNDSRCFKKLLKNRYYDEKLFHNSIATLKNLYEKNGFPSMSLIDFSLVPLKKEHEYNLIVTIDEGTCHYINTISVPSHPDIINDPLFQKEFITNKKEYNATCINQQKTWLLQYFQDQGYFYPHIKANITKNSDNGIDIAWNIDPGYKTYFGKTILTGTYKLRFEKLIKLICYKQQDPWNQEQIKQTFKTLKELNIFDAINIIPEISQTGEKTVITKLYADDTYEIKTRAGIELQHVRKYQTFNGLTYKLGGALIVKNPFEQGDIASVDLNFARSYQEIIARYKRPIFLTKPMMHSTQIYSISYDQPGFIGSINDIYTLIQQGFSCNFEQKITDFKYNVTIGCEAMTTKIKNVGLQKSLVHAIDFQPQLVDKPIPFFFLEPTAMLQYLDSPLNPSAGILTMCSLKAMLPLKKKYRQTLFVKLLCEQSLFIPLYPVVVALRLRFGHIFYRQLSAIIPSERFYLGGSHSLRAYQADLAPPLGIFVDEDMQEHIVPRGGKSMLNFNGEIRFSIIKTIGGVLFQDLGILSGNTFQDFKRQNLLSATGFGLRIYTPLGPLRFDIGWKWKKQLPQEQSYAWFLTFGNAF